MIRTLTLTLALSLLPGLAAGQDFVINDVSGADVVVLGEVHDNPAHHLWQAEVLQALEPSAVVFEMLTPEQAGRITPDLRSDPDALADVIGWAESGWPDFALYRPVFDALGAAAIHGAAQPSDAVRAAMSEGAAARFEGDPARFGLGAGLPEDQQARRERLQAAAHCDALPEALLPGMVEAQRLRDASFAATVLRALEETGGPVALITGNGHARTDWAVPWMIARAAPEVSVVSVAQFEAPPEAGAPFDAWRVTEPTERGDPCAAFGGS